MRNFQNSQSIGCLRLLLIIFCPPLAIIDKGLTAFVVVTLCTIFGCWVLGCVAAAAYAGD